MNSPSISLPLRVRAFGIAAALLTLGSISTLSAAALYWDANANGTDATYGGDGTWDGASTVWNTSATIGSGSLQAWTGGSADSANFLRNTTGTVTVSGTQTVGSMTLGSNTGSFTTGTGTAYTLNGGIIDIRAASFAVGLNNNLGTSTLNSQTNWFGGSTAGATNQQRININSGLLTLAGTVQDASGVSGTHNLSLELYSGSSLDISGNITKAAGSSGVVLLVGNAATANNIFVSLGGNNTGLTGAVALGRGTLTLNHSNALSGSTGVTVANVNTTVPAADTANLLIGTAGVTINQAITYTALTATDTSDIRTIGGSNTSGTAAFSGTITLNAFAASGTGSSLRVTSASGGTVDFSGNITDGSNSVALLLNGTGSVRFTRAAGMNYDGGTTVSSGTLLVNNTSGSGTGTGAVSVNSTATLGGSGIISGNTTLAAGSFLTPGASAGAAGNLTFGGNLDISGLAAGTGGLLFDLGAAGAGDKITLSTGALSIGSGVLDFNDFSFTALSGFGAGVYTLIGTSTSIVGTLGTNLTGTVSGLDASLSLSGNDVILTVTAIPEPSAFAVLLGASALGAVALSRRKRG
jgi:hypothetical protein